MPSIPGSIYLWLKYYSRNYELYSYMASDIDLRHLRTFVTLIREGGFSSAARQLGVTQSAVSHSMRLLQEDLGCALYYKVGRKVVKTRQGEALYQRAEKILHDTSQIRPLLASLDIQDRGTVRIGCTTSASQFILPGVLREFKECFPSYAISVHPGDTPGLLALLEANGVDVVIGLRPEEISLFEFKSIFCDELAFLVNSMHPWAGLKRSPTKGLADQTYILYPKGSLTFGLVEDYFLKQGVRLRSMIELASMEAIKELVKLGVGVGVIAPWVAAAEMISGSLRAIPLHPKIRREWAVFWMKSRPLNLAEQTFVGLCASVGANMQQSWKG